MLELEIIMLELEIIESITRSYKREREGIGTIDLD
jgi:hypothetical protein